SDPEIAARSTSGSDADRTDRTWIDRLVGGDLGALDLLYEQYGAMAFSIAYRITGDRSAAEDVVQDAFLGAWRRPYLAPLDRASPRDRRHPTSPADGRAP